MNSIEMIEMVAVPLMMDIEALHFEILTTRTITRVLHDRVAFDNCVVAN